MWLSTTTEHLEARDQLIEIVNVADPAHLKQSRQPKTLRRSTLDLLLLVWGDVFAILLWFAILVYASLLWYSHGKKEIDLSDGMFDPEELMGLARPVGFQKSSCLPSDPNSYRPSSRFCLPQPQAER